MVFFKERNESECHFVVFAPDWWALEPREWTLRAFVRGEWVREAKVPMVYPTQFGVDVSDVQAMEEAFNKMVEEVLAEASDSGPNP